MKEQHSKSYNTRRNEFKKNRNTISTIRKRSHSRIDLVNN